MDPVTDVTDMTDASAPSGNTAHAAHAIASCIQHLEIPEAVDASSNHEARVKMEDEADSTSPVSPQP